MGVESEDKIRLVKEQLKTMLEVPTEGFLPEVYFATSKEATESQRLYHSGELTPQKYKDALYDSDEEGAHRVIQLNLYTTMSKLAASAKGFSFHETVGKGLARAIQIDQLVTDAGGTSPRSELGEVYNMIIGLFTNSGPTVMPHVHTKIFNGIDSYMATDLGFGYVWTNDGYRQLFTEKYDEHGLDFSSITTIRYQSPKPGIVLDELERIFMQQAAMELELLPELLESQQESIVKQLSALKAEEDFQNIVQQKQTESEMSGEEITVIELLSSFSALNPARSEEINGLITEIISLTDVRSKQRSKFVELFEKFTQDSFRLSTNEFLDKFKDKVDWLYNNSLTSVIQALWQLGLTPIISLNIWDNGKEAMDLTKYPDNAILLTSKEQEDGEGNKYLVDMVLAFPLPKAS